MLDLFKLFWIHIFFCSNMQNSGAQVFFLRDEADSNAPKFSCRGERGIRTPGTSQYGGFQDRWNKPLSHLSVEKWCKGTIFFWFRKIFMRFSAQ